MGALCSDDRCLYVRLSVGPMPDAKSRTKGVASWKLAGGKPMTQVTRDPS